MNPRRRQGKVFTLLLLILYLICAIAALVFLLTRFGDMPRDIGEYQAGLLHAYDAADKKRLYTQDAAMIAVREAFAQLYTDSNAYFKITYGDGESEDCGYYGYSTIADPRRSCPPQGNPMQAVLGNLSHNLAVPLGTLQRGYPGGSFSASFMVTPSLRPPKIHLQFRGEEPYPEEPIYLGLTPAVNTGAISDALNRVGGVAGLTWPASEKVITSCFGPREGVAEAASNIHHGMDAPQGIVVAAEGGEVINDPSSTSYGTIWIQHSPTLSTRYLHVRDIRVRQGQQVFKGMYLGVSSDVGCREKGCAPHLHFEVLVTKVPSTATHAYTSKDRPGWYAVNPVCFFDNETLESVSIASSATQSCALQDDPKTAYCDEYGVTVGSDADPLDVGNIDYLDASMADPANPPVLGLTDDPIGDDEVRATQSRMILGGWGEYVSEAEREHGVPSALILAVITKESVGNSTAISSYKGCCAGLMQIRDATTQDISEFKGKSVTPCGENCKRYGAANCRCNIGNDARFNTRTNIVGGTEYLARLLHRYEDKTDKCRLALAAYNAGMGNVGRAIERTGLPDPSWTEVMPEIEELISDDNYRQVTDYVLKVMRYAEIWNDNQPLAYCGGDAVLQEAIRQADVSIAGTFTWDPTFSINAEDHLTPWAQLVPWIRATTEACSRNSDPERCLVERATKHAVPVMIPHLTLSQLGLVVEQEGQVNRELAKRVLRAVDSDRAFTDPAAAWLAAKQIFMCEEDPAIEYYTNLLASIKDCARNKQRDCACELPRAPNATSSSEIRIYPEENYATISETRIRFDNLTSDGLTLVYPYETGPRRVTPEMMTGLQYYKIQLVEQEGGGVPVAGFVFTNTDGNRFESTFGNFAVERREHPFTELLITRPNDLPLCAPVKTGYRMCSNASASMPLAKWSVRLNDQQPPLPPRPLSPSTVKRYVESDRLAREAMGIPYTGTPVRKDMSYDPDSGTVTFLQSPSPDISFYYVYFVPPFLPGAGGRFAQISQDPIQGPKDPFGHTSNPRMIGYARDTRESNGQLKTCVQFTPKDADTDFTRLGGELLFVAVDKSGIPNFREYLVVPIPQTIFWPPLIVYFSYAGELYDQDVPAFGRELDSYWGQVCEQRPQPTFEQRMREILEPTPASP